MMPRRFDHWPELLEAFLAQHRATPFEWGRFDCALFACDAIHIMTGTDPAVDFRFQYSTELGAARKMKKFAGGGLEEVAIKVTAAQGMAEIAVSLAQRGDVMLFDTEEHGPALGIVSLQGHAVHFASEQGLALIPLTACRRAWKVG